MKSLKNKILYLLILFFPLCIISVIFNNLWTRIFFITGIYFFVFLPLVIYLNKKFLKKNKDDKSYFENKINELNNLIIKKNEEFLELDKTKEKNIISIKNELKILNDILNGKIQSLPVLNGQLNAVIEHSNESVEELIVNFLNIDKKVKEQNTNTETILNSLGLNNSSNITILEKYKIVFNDLFNNITKIASIIQNIFNEFVKIINKFNSLNTIIDSIKEFSDKTRLLSLNAMIESARAGESGKGFKIVAQEVRTLSDKISSFLLEEERLVENLLKQSNDQISLLNIEQDKIKNITKNSKEHITDVLNDMDNAVNSLRSRLNDIQLEGVHFSNEINKIVVSFQFQDIIRQRIEHVIEPLDSIYTEIHNKLNLITDINSRIKSIEEKESLRTTEYSNLISDWLKNFYTMSDEKEILNKHLNKQFLKLKR